MGTNYYVHSHGKTRDPEKDLHVGKQSAGWRFLFAREFLIPDWEEVKAKIIRCDGQIYDEYGSEVSANDLLIKIMERSLDREYDGDIRFKWADVSDLWSKDWS